MRQWMFETREFCSIGRFHILSIFRAIEPEILFVQSNLAQNRVTYLRSAGLPAIEAAVSVSMMNTVKRHILLNLMFRVLSNKR